MVASGMQRRGSKFTSKALLSAFFVGRGGVPEGEDGGAFYQRGVRLELLSVVSKNVFSSNHRGVAPTREVVYEAEWAMYREGDAAPHRWKRSFTMDELKATVKHLDRVYGHGNQLSRVNYFVKDRLVQKRPWKEPVPPESIHKRWALTLWVLGRGPVWLLCVLFSLRVAWYVIEYLAGWFSVAMVSMNIPDHIVILIRPFLYALHTILVADGPEHGGMSRTPTLWDLAASPTSSDYTASDESGFSVAAIHAETDVWWRVGMMAQAAISQSLSDTCRMLAMAISLPQIALGIVWVVSVLMAAATTWGMVVFIRVLPTLPFPAKIMLENPKMHLKTVETALEDIANSRDPILSSLTLCSFLGIGAATFSGISSTLHEGKAYVRVTDKESMHSNMQPPHRWSFCCFHFNWSFDMGFQTPRYERRWAVLSYEGIAVFRDTMDREPAEAILFDSNFAVYHRSVNGRSGIDAHRSEPVDMHEALIVFGAAATLELRFPTAFETMAWSAAINRAAAFSLATKDNRHSSSFRVRQNHIHPNPSPLLELGDKCFHETDNDGVGVVGDEQEEAASRAWAEDSIADWLVDGRRTFWEIARAIGDAKKDVYIGGWFLTPHVPLIRFLPGEPLSREFKLMPMAVQAALRWDPEDKSRSVSLSTLIKIKAQQNVRVMILLFCEFSTILPNNSEYAMQELRKANEDMIFVMSHRR
jgi:hypothetical protein